MLFKAAVAQKSARNVDRVRLCGSSCKSIYSAHTLDTDYVYWRDNPFFLLLIVA